MEDELLLLEFSLVLEWAVLHREVLRQNWLIARKGVPLQEIPTLE